MKDETKSIDITVYRDSKGNPTCAKDFPTGQICRFYRTQRFGCHETCVFADDSGKFLKSMIRRGKGDGSLVPLDNCPLWDEDEVSQIKVGSDSGRSNYKDENRMYRCPSCSLWWEAEEDMIQCCSDESD